MTLTQPYFDCKGRTMDSPSIPTTLERALDESQFERRATPLDWPTLEQYARTLADDPERWVDRLIECHDHVYAAMNLAFEEGRYEATSPAGLVEIPSVIGLAGPRLATDLQTDIVDWALDNIATAIEDDDDLVPEIMTSMAIELGEVAFNRAAQAIRNADPDDEEIWMTGWFEWWAIAKHTVGKIGATPDRQALDDRCRQRLGETIRCNDADELEWLIWYLVRSDRQYVDAHIDEWIKQAKAARRGARWPLAVEDRLKDVRWYLDGDPNIAKIYVCSEDFRTQMDHRATWLQKQLGKPMAAGQSAIVVDDHDPDEPYIPPPPPPPIDQPIVRDEPRIGRNDPCPCGSGKKYKKCCMNA